MTAPAPERAEYDFSAAIWDFLERTEHFGHGAWSWGDAREPEVLLCACGSDVLVPDGAL